MTENEVTVAAVDWEAYEQQFEGALKEAKTLDDVEHLRVEYVGRKSPLAQALREVRDRETGMLLNSVQERCQEPIRLLVPDTFPARTRFGPGSATASRPIRRN